MLWDSKPMICEINLARGVNKALIHGHKLMLGDSWGQHLKILALSSTIINSISQTRVSTSCKGIIVTGQANQWLVHIYADISSFMMKYMHFEMH